MNRKSPSPRTPDPNIFCERLAERLHAQGVAHPVAAAVALTARGLGAKDVDQLAAEIGVPTSPLRDIEAGTVAFVDLPDELLHAFARIPSASLFLMADLESRLAR
jgi:hypothetical protein